MKSHSSVFPLAKIFNPETETTKPQKERFVIRVRATDGGSPPLDADVDVELDVVDRNNKPPVWQQQSYGPIYVKENAAAGTTVTSVRARFVASERARVRGPVQPLRGQDGNALYCMTRLSDRLREIEGKSQIQLL